MLNPSKAGTTVVNDQTIKKCIRFAQLNGYDGIEVVNLFPLVSTDQDGLARYDGSGDEEHNLNHILDAASRLRIVVAFGANFNRQRKRALRIASKALIGKELLSIGAPTKQKYPRHPCYAPYELQLLPYDLGAILE